MIGYLCRLPGKLQALTRCSITVICMAVALHEIRAMVGGDVGGKLIPF